MKISVAQFQGHDDKEKNIERATQLANQAAEQGANVICYHEIFNTIYFCYKMDYEFFKLAEPIDGPTVEKMARVAEKTGMVVIAPFFESTITGQYYNSAAILGPRGQLIGHYRKMSIPLVYRPENAAGNEKFYFAPGNLGFPAFDTPWGVKIGVLICYDRHFPEAARILALNGAQVMFAPSATFGQTQYAWEAELKGHALANVFYVAGINKVRPDIGGPADRHYYGNSMIISPRGEILARADDQKDQVLVADLDMEEMTHLREMWGFFRDRRPDAYGGLVK